jgi:hypothetical protein
MAPFKSGDRLVRCFLHDLLERRRVSHYTLEVLRTRQSYLNAIPDTTLRFNLGLRQAMKLRRMSLAADQAAGGFICDSQGGSKKPRIPAWHYRNYTVSFI